jgi:hypothetical protein
MPDDVPFNTPDIESLFCDLCKTRLDSAEEFKEHLRTKHNIPA